MADTLLRRPSLHFTKLHPAPLPRLLCNRGNITSTLAIAKACLCESDDTWSVTLEGTYACPFINLLCRWHQLMASPYLWHPFGPGIYLKLEWEKKKRAEEVGDGNHRLIYSHNFTVALVCRCSYSFDWSINRTGCCRWHPTATQTGHWSSHEPLPPYTATSRHHTHHSVLLSKSPTESTPGYWRI